MSDADHEARALVRLVERGVLNQEDARRLINVTLGQQRVLQKFFGSDFAECVIAYRQQILKQFDDLVKQP